MVLCIKVDFFIFVLGCLDSGIGFIWGVSLFVAQYNRFGN